MQATRLLSSPKQLMEFILMYPFLSCYFLIPADAQSFTLKMNRAVPQKGSSLVLSCEQSFTNGVIKLWKGSEIVADCASKDYGCSQFDGYSSTANQTGVFTTISNLNRQNEGTYTCICKLNKTESLSNKLNLVVYTIPSRLDFTQVPDMNLDLSVTSAQLNCTTFGCTYPPPLIQWLTQGQTASSPYEVYKTLNSTGTGGSCVQGEELYTSTLDLVQNTTWSDNSDKILNFSCRIEYPDSTMNLIASGSKTIRFAVRVTEAYLQQSSQNITSTLTVNSGEPVTLTCVTGTSRPDPNIIWYIGSRSIGNGTSLVFTPSNTDHNGSIYCQAYNIDPDHKVDSNKPSLFVRVRVTEAFLQQNNQNVTSTLNVSFQASVTLTCVTGTSRPAPNIGWYIGSRSVGSGTNLTFTPSNTDHNEVIFCQAYNIDPNLKVDSNKPRLFVRVKVLTVTLEGSTGGNKAFNEGYPQTLKCNSSPSRPVPIIRWLLDNKNMTDNITNITIPYGDELYVLRSEITLVLMRNSSNQKLRCEGFIIGQETSAVPTEVVVDVRYAPDVRVNTLGNTVVSSSLVLMCVPKGNPPQYTFHPWIHMVGQTEIRRLNGVNTSNNSTLTLSNISIQDTGLYICTVDNAIPGLNRQVNQIGYKDIDVQGLPVFDKIQLPFAGEPNNSTNIEIRFYSYPSIQLVKFINQSDSSELSNTSNIAIYMSPSNISMMFYEKKVMRLGHVAVLHFRNLTDTDFGNYTLHLSNDQGTVTLPFDFIVSAAPSMPKKFFFINIKDDHLVFGIEKGFNGGHEQTFIVEYQLVGMPDATWYIFMISENALEDPFTNGTYYLKIPKISDGQYIFKVHAENKKGNSSSIEVEPVEIKTALSSPVVTVFPIGAVAGGVVGGILVVIVIVVALVITRRTIKPKMKAFEREMESTDRNHRKSQLTNNPVYDASDSRSGTGILAVTHAEDPSKVYAQVVKTKTKKEKAAAKGKYGKTSRAASEGKHRKTSRGDIYENAAQVVKSSAENVYENPGQLATGPSSGDNVYETPDASVSKGQVSKDGLLYADVILGPPSTKGRKPIIHGLEDRTVYADIDYGKRGKPLPESDEGEGK